MSKRRRRKIEEITENKFVGGGESNGSKNNSEQIKKTTLELFNKILNLNPENDKEEIKKIQGEIFQLNSKLIDNVVYKFFSYLSEEQKEEAKNVGMEYLFLAIKNFDLEKGATFSYFAFLSIKNGILEWRKKSELINIRQHFYEILKIYCELLEKNSELTLEQMAVDINSNLNNSNHCKGRVDVDFLEKRIIPLVPIYRQMFVSMDHGRSSLSSDVRGDDSLHNFIPANTDNDPAFVYEEKSTKESIKDIIKIIFKHESLTDSERNFLKELLNFYFNNENETRSFFSKDLFSSLNVSRQRLGQYRDSVFQKITNPKKNPEKELANYFKELMFLLSYKPKPKKKKEE